MNKTDRILMIPTDVPPAEVVSKLSAEGVKVTAKYVRKVRAKSKAKQTFGSKAAFIRSMPSDMPAKEVVEAAKKKGLQVTAGHVYMLRSKERDRSLPKRKPGRPAKHASPSPKAPTQRREAIVVSTDGIKMPGPSILQALPRPDALKSTLEAFVDARARLVVREMMRELLGGREWA